MMIDTTIDINITSEKKEMKINQSRKDDNTGDD
jgi:hypothetical protein